MADNGQEHIIRVRDRRARHQFSIHNRIIDDWLPIIGLPGLGLYNLYCRMSNSADERAWPGYSFISQHLSISKSTISCYNELLEWCDLIHIEPGNRRMSNDYYVLEIPTLTDERLAGLRIAVEAARDREVATEQPNQGKLQFMEFVLERIDNWRPAQSYWGKKPRPTVVHPDQTSFLDDQGGSTAEDHSSTVEYHPSTVEYHPGTTGDQGGTHAVLEQSLVTILSNNPEQQSTATSQSLSQHECDEEDDDTNDVGAVASFLQEHGIVGTNLARVAERVDLDTARAWVLYTLAEREQFTNPPGFIVSQILCGVEPPPDFLVLGSLPQADLDWMWDHREQIYWLPSDAWPADMPLTDDLACLWWQYFGHEGEQGQKEARRVYA
ncbi:MAG TPA: hypothetical protein VMY40_15675 [Anaerolineae bacterium]|nr:hypothetical protein [Anaerolineae bacterium]